MNKRRIVVLLAVVIIFLVVTLLFFRRYPNVKNANRHNSGAIEDDDSSEVFVHNIYPVPDFKPASDASTSWQYRSNGVKPLSQRVEGWPEGKISRDAQQPMTSELKTFRYKNDLPPVDVMLKHDSGPFGKGVDTELDLFRNQRRKLPVQNFPETNVHDRKDTLENENPLHEGGRKYLVKDTSMYDFDDLDKNSYNFKDAAADDDDDDGEDDGMIHIHFGPNVMMDLENVLPQQKDLDAGFRVKDGVDGLESEHKKDL